ncbi:hypothetical protein BZ13_1232 [Francisella philomiragia subsp. philomiragia ATCC 25015]|uniref:response regulator transcription factor n=1 Tax=Francisella philomiragia TaxID=28110 RepID=UPI0001AF7A5B|nr:response regulator transcription factor [Francisella philomiragia]AJI74916.1 hypothetical protein BZ13_1232 [Francisella philomiragia subsp. philomiragia ATCC 25015]EET20573.1 conserved hypothetical protein [Francisella philomiragia subsp. philomiragia ATCC 25015]MBK2237615.1 response regulator transcription factor [Francisella philomiragia]
MKSILIVDDEKEILNSLRYILENEGYNIYTAESTVKAERIIESFKEIDLILLDIMMPGENGLDFCKRLRSRKNINIIIASASNDEIDQILSYEFGAKNYISKPFNKKLLLAKVKSILSANKVEEYRYVTFNGFVFDTLMKTIKNEQDIVYNLSMIEYSILSLLIDNVYEFVNRDDLFQAVYNCPYDGYSRKIDVAISKLRKKIGDKEKNIIVTSSQNGYSLNIELQKSNTIGDI